MRIVGKLIGAILGWMLLKHPAGALLGLVVGHAFDAGWFRRQAPKADKDYATLGLTRDASDEEVERAYRRLMSQYHPDKVAGAAEEIRQIAETRARSINTAYEAIQRQRKPRD